MFSLSITILLTAMIFFTLGWLTKAWVGKDNKKETKLTEELQATKDELYNYQLEISNYFDNTATLFNNLSIQYKNLYEHLANSAKKLCKTESLTSKPLLKHEETHTNWHNLILGQETGQKPDHNWHPTYFEARDAKAQEENTSQRNPKTLETKEAIKFEDNKSNNNENKQKNTSTKEINPMYETSTIE